MRTASLLAGLSVAMLAGFSAQAQAPQAIQLGVLTCRGGADIGFIVGSVTHLRCTLTADGRSPQPYVATIRKVGIDLGITENTALSWAVFAPVNYSGPGDLSGNYGGAQASATFIVGLGANVLVGGSQNSFALQPVSVQGSTGLSVAAGLESLELRPGR
jgi:hypothetical protein